MRTSGSAIRQLAAQVARFLGAGAFITGLYLSVTTVLAEGLGLPFQIALAAGYFAGVTVHFLLHRYFTFASQDDYELSTANQLARFVTLVIVQYGLTAAAVALLPGALGLTELVVWLGAVCLLTPLSFVLLRTKLFHPASGEAVGTRV